MKSTLFFVVFLLAVLFTPQNLLSQVRTSSKIYTASDSLKVAFQIIDTQEQKLYGMQYCFRKFYNEYLTGVLVTGVGAGITVASIGYDDPELTGAGVLLGGAVSLAGIVYSLSSFRWMNRAGISPARYGLGFRIRLD